MKKILFRVERVDGNYYILEGSSELVSERELIKLIKNNEVSANMSDEDTIDTGNFSVIRDSSQIVVNDLPKDIDLHLINICKEIRKLALLDRVTLDETTHTGNQGLNTHLLKYIEYCGQTPLGYIKDYLSHLQPYMIEELPKEEYHKKIICVLDKLYRISVYIKVDTTQHKEVIVSFHESNKRGIAKTNSLISKTDINKTVPVFAEEITAQSGDKYSLRVLIQRGMLVLPISMIGRQCKDFFLVNMRDIDNYFLDYCNDYIKDLYTSDLDLDFDSISVFSMLQQISFTSYGRDTFSSISLLIDSVATQRDTVSRKVASFALYEFTKNLKLTAAQTTDLICLLEEKFRVTDIKGISSILNYIEDILKANLLT